MYTMYFNKEVEGLRGKDMEIQQDTPYSPFFSPGVPRTIRQPAIFLFFVGDLNVLTTDKTGVNPNLIILNMDLRDA